MSEINDITTPLSQDENIYHKKVQDFISEVSNDKEEIYFEGDKAKNNVENISSSVSHPIKDDSPLTFETSNRTYASKSDVDLLQPSNTLIENGLNYVNNITPNQ
jgi:hypothetical protein